MDKDKQQLVTRMNSAVEAFKKERNYVSLLNHDVSLHQFQFTDERGYNDVIRGFAVKKSELVTMFSEPENLQLWAEHTSPQLKRYLFDIAQSQSLIITEHDYTVLSTKDHVIPHGYPNITKSFTLSEIYTEERARHLTHHIEEMFLDIGLAHLKTQELAQQSINAAEKTWESKQQLFITLQSTLGEHYDKAWTDFKLAVKYNEIEANAEHFVVNAKIMNKSQKIQFNIDKDHHIVGITFLPPMNIVNAIRDKATESNRHNNTHSMNSPSPQLKDIN